MDADAHRQLKQAVDLLDQVFGANTLGAYCYGSALLGGLRYQSDLDVVVVSERPATHDERAHLIGGLLDISGRYPRQGARSLELTVVVQSDVRPWRYPPSKDLHYGEWWRTEFGAGNLSPWDPTDPDIAVLLTSARLRSLVLFGPPLSSLTDPIPRSDLNRAVVDSVPDLVGELENDSANVILTLARVGATLVTGEILAKDAAADWLLPMLPAEHRPLLEAARDAYLRGTTVGLPVGTDPRHGLASR